MMKFASLAVTAALIGMPALAADGTASVKPVCLQTNRIKSTQIVDRSTILFHMVGGKTWRNTMASPCQSMTKSSGFIYTVSGRQVCSNLEQITINFTGESCVLGAFTPN